MSYFFKSLNRTIIGNISNRPSNIAVDKTTFEREVKFAKFSISKQSPTFPKAVNTELTACEKVTLSKLIIKIVAIKNIAYSTI